MGPQTPEILYKSRSFSVMGFVYMATCAGPSAWRKVGAVMGDSRWQWIPDHDFLWNRQHAEYKSMECLRNQSRSCVIPQTRRHTFWMMVIHSSSGDGRGSGPLGVPPAFGEAAAAGPSASPIGDPKRNTRPLFLKSYHRHGA